MTARRAKREKRGSGGGSPRKYDDLLTDPSDLDAKKAQTKKVGRRNTYTSLGWFLFRPLFTGEITPRSRLLFFSWRKTPPPRTSQARIAGAFGTDFRLNKKSYYYTPLYKPTQKIHAVVAGPIQLFHHFKYKSLREQVLDLDLVFGVLYSNQFLIVGL